MNGSIGNERTLGGERSGGRDVALHAGDVFGQYRIVRLLGRGGMGEVYEAEHRVLGRRFALKLLPPELMSQPGALERFEREARVMAQLEHPNIVRVDDFGQTEGRTWLRMELANGVPVRGRPAVSLQDLADAYGGRVEQTLLAGILEQVLNGLAYAHERGVVHRDLKPSNILIWTVSSGPVYRIADFGLARLVGEEWLRSRVQESVRQSMSMVGDTPTVAAEAATSTRSLLGTWEYMSPEQKRGEEADARSDLYAVGLIAYRLLTGRGFSLKRPSKIVPGLSVTWDDLLEAVTEENRDERIANCADFLARLRSGRASVRHAPAPVPEAPPVPAVIPAADAVPSSTSVAFPKMDRPWTNSLGMKLAPVPGTEVLFCVWETRNKDYRAFRPYHDSGAFENQSLNGDDQPVVNVSWEDAKAFCEWLTKKELQNHLIAPPQAYRIPFDWEWSVAVGLCEPRDGTPSYKDAKIPGVYPWGTQWPPPKGAGNYADATARRAFGRLFSGVTTIRGYDDGFAATSPVGSFPASPSGLFDLGGNVWEWCEDWYDANQVYRVLRGASWLSDVPTYLLSSGRRESRPESLGGNSGFRLVLAPYCS